METLGSETVRKGSRAYFNLFSMLLQRKLGAKKVRGYPFILTLDPSSVCQLRCPFCPTGSHESRPENSTKSRRCDWLYFRAAINANGSVSPCCVVPIEQDDFGRLAGGDFKHVYNNEKYQAARALFTGQANGHTPTICDHCPWPSQQSMLDWVPPLVVAQNPFLRRVIGRVRQTLSH